MALSSSGHHIDLLTYHLGDEVDIPGVVIHRIPGLPFINSIKPGPSLAKLFLDPLIFIKSILMLIFNRYEVIHSHEEASFFAGFLAKLFGTKHLYDMHSSLPKQLDAYQYGNYSLFIGIFKALERYTLRSSDAVVTVGVDLDQWVKEVAPSANTFLIENLPIQTTIERPGPDSVERVRQNLGLNGKHIVVYTGTFEPYQGLGMLIDSARIVVDECPVVRFLLIGGNEQQVKQYRQLADDKNLDHCFHFTGNVPATEATAYLELASVVVSPRLGGTSIPLKIYTYLLSGKPLVATGLAAHRQVLSEDFAILTEPNKEDFAQGILQILKNPEYGRQLAQRARVYAEDKYEFTKYQNKLNSVYLSLENSKSYSERSKPSSKKQ
jgi:glycosyltransferase involved in cell wall biosynthesis